jgi:hypothetical protein
MPEEMKKADRKTDNINSKINQHIANAKLRISEANTQEEIDKHNSFLQSNINYLKARNLIARNASKIIALFKRMGAGKQTVLRPTERQKQIVMINQRFREGGDITTQQPLKVDLKTLHEFLEEENEVWLNKLDESINQIRSQELDEKKKSITDKLHSLTPEGLQEGIEDIKKHLDEVLPQRKADTLLTILNELRFSKSPLTFIEEIEQGEKSGADLLTDDIKNYAQFLENLNLIGDIVRHFSHADAHWSTYKTHSEREGQ